MYGHAHVRSGLLGRARSGPSRLTLNSYFALKKFWIMASHYIGRLLDELARPNGKLDNLKEKLRFGRTEKVSFTQNPLGRSKKSLVFKVTATRQGYNYPSDSFVVKMNPHNFSTTLHNVHKEFRLLSQLHGSVPVPEPLYCSSEADKDVGLHFCVISEVPEKHLKNVFESVMRALGFLHSEQWKSPDGGVHRYESASSFWYHQVDKWTQNYKEIVGWSGWYLWTIFGSNKESYLFDKMLTASHPNGRTARIHGSLDIGNVIFDENFDVKAIIDWKYELNGDPMMDLACLLMVFLSPSDYNMAGYFKGSKLILPRGSHNIEADALKVYKENSEGTFSVGDLFYAKAVCCLRCISIIKKASSENFVNHESGQYQSITSNPDAVIELLRKAGWDYFNNRYMLQ